MPPMLPAGFPAKRSLADVMPSCLAALGGGGGGGDVLSLGSAQSIVVVLVDGLGVHALRERAGHARTLSSALGRGAAIRSVFPSTTASGLASLTTGTYPGQHGLVGYRVRDVAGGRLVNQLSGWDAGMHPEVWQPNPTVFERATAHGIRSIAVGPRRFRDSGLTRAILRGAEYLPADSVADRFASVARVLRQRPSGQRVLAYLYVSELDTAGHAHGWDSAQWTAELERVDAELGALLRSLDGDVGVLVTADHGVIDVPSEQHVVVDAAMGLFDGVDLVGGEPRCLQLYLPEDAVRSDRDAVAERWRAEEGSRAWVATRDEAIEAGWFGAGIRSGVQPRIGDVLVAARARVAYYDGRDAARTGRLMIGQHGSFSDEEMRIPFLRYGALAS